MEDWPFLRLMENWDFKCIIGIQRSLELSTSAICMIMNAYFAVKFQRLSSFHPNFRIVLISLHLIMAITTFLHPILQMIPPHCYSIKNGRILGAIFFYTIAYAQNITLFFSDTKYLVIGLERHFAMKNRHTYERTDGSDAKTLLWRMAIVLSIFTILKNVLAFYYLQNLPLDERLQTTFSVDLWAPAMIFPVSIATISYFYGLYEFINLSRFVKRNYYLGTSLTESFQIRQSGVIVDVLWPIMIAFAVAIVFAVFFQIHWMYYHFIRDKPMSSDICQFNITCLYLIGCIYNNYSTAYMLWFFKPLRQALISDVFRLLGLTANTSQVEPAPIDFEFERENHFQQMQKTWETVIQPK